MNSREFIVYGPESPDFHMHNMYNCFVLALFYVKLFTMHPYVNNGKYIHDYDM